MILAVLLIIIACACLAGDGVPQHFAAKTSRVAAEQCSLKLKKLEEFAANQNAGERQTIQFSEEEVNSYLALDLIHKYHPSLKSLAVTFEKEKLHGVALLDFDQMEAGSEGFLPKILNMLLTGKHTLAVRGQVLSGNGKASFRLEQAWLDGHALPNFLVEEIIATVCKKHQPPFNPLQPSEMPYKIQSVELHKGFVMVYQ